VVPLSETCRPRLPPAWIRPPPFYVVHEKSGVGEKKEEKKSTSLKCSSPSTSAKRRAMLLPRVGGGAADRTLGKPNCSQTQVATVSAECARQGFCCVRPRGGFGRTTRKEKKKKNAPSSSSSEKKEAKKPTKQMALKVIFFGAATVKGVFVSRWKERLAEKVRRVPSGGGRGFW